MEVPGGEIRWDSRDRESRFCLFGEQVSGVRIDTRHRPSERDRLLLVSEQEQDQAVVLALVVAVVVVVVSEQEQEDQAATNCDQVSPILRTTPFQKPEIWCSTCGRYGSHWKLPKPGESSEL